MGDPTGFPSREYAVLDYINAASGITASAAIWNSYLIAEQSFEKTDLYESFGAIRDDIESAINAGKDGLTDLNLKWASHQESEVTKYPFRNELYQACYLIFLAKKHNEDGEKDKAWSLIYTSNAHLNSATECVERWRNEEKTSEDRKRRSEKAKDSRAQKLLPVKNLVVELLTKLRPRGGWSKKSDAVKVIKDEVAEYVRRNRGCGLAETNLQNRISEWTRKDRMVKSAWEKSKKGDHRRTY